MDANSTLERVRAALPMALLASFHPIAHVDEYGKFLALKLLRNDVDALPPALSPSHLVDAVWHTHMLHPHEYVRTCVALLSGRRATAAAGDAERRVDDGTAVFKHSPVPRVDESRYVETLLLYEAVFGSKPNALVWPDETLPTVQAQVQVLASAPPTLAYAVPVATAVAAATTATTMAAATATVTTTIATTATTAKTAPTESLFMSVHVKTLADKAYAIRISPDATIDQLKRTLHALGVIAPSHQRIVFAGRVLEDARVLRECGVHDGSALHVVQLAC